MSIVEKIEHILRDASDKDSEIRQLLDGLDCELPIIPLYLRAGSRLIRGAINWLPGCFNKIEQLSYKKADLNKEYQRASIPGKTMFYTCPFTHSASFEDGIFIPRLTSLMEIKSIYVKNVDGIQRVTFSRWDAQSDIRVFALPFFGDYERPCDEIKYIQSIWNDQVLSQSSYSDDAMDLIKHLSFDISKSKDNPEDYMFTAIFIDWFMNRHPEYKGIYYPSVQTSGEGANIAFLPQLIDDGIISFVNASECWIFKRATQTKMITVFNLENTNGTLTPILVDFREASQVLFQDFPVQDLSFLN